MAKKINKNELQQYKDIANSLLERDRKLKFELMPRMDKLGNMEWELPESLRTLTWLVPRPDASPRNAEIAGVRAYSTMWPSISVDRPGATQADIERYNRIEDTLAYHFMMASQRPSLDMPMFGSTPTERIIRSALRYGEVAVQVVHVESQLKFMGNVNAARERAIRRYGDFLINVHYPQSVHVQASGMALDGVLLRKRQTLASFEAFWGELAKPVVETATKKNSEDTYVISYDYSNYDVRVVWARCVGDTDKNFDSYMTALDGIVILHEENKMPFLTWSWHGGIEPLNYAVDKTRVWDAAGLAETLAFSDIIRYASSIQGVITGPNAQDIEVDYTQPANLLRLTPGNEYREAAPPMVNEGQVTMGDRARGDLRSMTVPDVVMNLSSAANEAYATFDQRLKSGMAAYEPFKGLAELAHSDIFSMMLYWSKYLKSDLKGPRIEERGGVRSFVSGDEFVLKPETIDYNARVRVELSGNKPLDDVQKLTAASQAVQYLNMSTADALERVGERNPQDLEKNKALEMLRMSRLQSEIQVMQAQAQYESQLALAGLRDVAALVSDPQIGPQVAQMLQQMLQQQQNPQPQMQGIPTESAEMMSAGGIPTVGGMGFDPNQGGIPPAMADPAATFEGQTGLTRGDV